MDHTSDTLCFSESHEVAYGTLLLSHTWMSARGKQGGMSPELIHIEVLVEGRLVCVLWIQLHLVTLLEQMQTILTLVSSIPHWRYTDPDPTQWQQLQLTVYMTTLTSTSTTTILPCLNLDRLSYLAWSSLIWTNQCICTPHYTWWCRGSHHLSDPEHTSLVHCLHPILFEYHLTWIISVRKP